MNDLVFKGANNLVLTNSLLVAQKFGKRHSDVIRSIEKLLNVEDKSLNAKMRLAFESTSYDDVTGKSNPMYIMNEKGFSILVMGWNGVNALKFKDENPILLTSDNGLQVKAKGLKISTISLKEFLRH